MAKQIVIDDDNVLHSFYADRTMFIVSIDPNLVEILIDPPDEVRFKLRKIPKQASEGTGSMTLGIRLLLSSNRLR